MSRNIGTIFLPSAPKMCNHFWKKKKRKKKAFDDKNGIIRNEIIIFVDLIDV